MYSHETTKATKLSQLGSRAKVNVLHKMADIELLSDRRNSHLLNLMYKRNESPQYKNNLEGKTTLSFHSTK